jgi:hypothetical protein
MRDKVRIEPLLNKFKALWLDNPDLRFGQLIIILSNYTDNSSIFCTEEKDWDKAINIFIHKLCLEKYEIHNCNEEHGCTYCKFNQNEEYELPCIACQGTEIMKLKGYSRPCYFKQK